ncbi:MAG TPA: aspartate kinase [Candidatus Aminicenantes bacterium]|nr:aspartate kinase [Acidobacteriota bacterium]HOI45042.1 aspartate kinase [Candidatus Aminicenantes bacterium]
MITIPEAVERIVRKSPFLEEGLTMKIFNLSALARLIRPDVEKHVMKDVQDGAIIVALSRLSRRIQKRIRQTKSAFRTAPDLIVRSNLFEMTFAASETLPLNQKRLLDRTARYPNAFVTLTHGINETTLIAGRDLEAAISANFKDEKLIKKIVGLSSVTLMLPKNTAQTPGVYSHVLKALAMEGINVIEVVSTLNEFTIILEDKDIDSSFSIIKRLF